MAEDVFEIVGTVVGGAFNVEAVVAEGGFAVVYRAYHGAFHAPVALKCLKVPSVSRGSQRDFLERFREEGELMFRLSQSIPSVVRPLHIDAFETAKGVFVPYMAQEWLDGETLDVIIAKRTMEGRPPMATKPVIRLLTPVARALARAHHFPGPNGAVSIIHRDLKPDNIIVANINGEEVVKLLDFGIAKVRSVASHNAGKVSHEGGQIAVPFTPGYAAPEQWFPKRYGQTGPWTDVWGLALTAVEALSGKAAIDGDHAAMMGTAIDGQRRPSPRTEGAKVTDEVEAIFLRALAVDPRERYQDVGEFWDALESACGMGHSTTPKVGFVPQPHRDPRSEGAPAAREELIEAAKDSQRLSIRAPAVSRDSRGRAPTPAEGRAARSPAVPDLELAVDVRAVVRAENARRAESTAKLRAVGEEELARLGMNGGKAPGSGPHAAVVIGPSDVVVAPAPSTPVEIAEVRLEDLSGSGPDGVAAGSGLDLAVAPELVRRSSHKMPAVSAQQVAEAAAAGRVSQNKMQAANAQQLSVAPGRRASQHKMQAVGAQPASEPGNLQSPSSRSGQIRAVGPSPVPAARPSAAQSAQAAPLLAKASRKLILPIALIVVGLGITLAFYVNASSGGGVWSLGPVPINWIAGILVVVGTAVLLVRIFVTREE